MIEFPVVVHAVFVGVMLARIRRDITAFPTQILEFGAIARRALDRRREQDVGGRCIPVGVEWRGPVAQRTPNFRRHLEIIRTVRQEFLQGCTVNDLVRVEDLQTQVHRHALLDGAQGRVRTVSLVLDFTFRIQYRARRARIGADKRIFHERRHIVVIAEVAHLLDEILLSVCKTVVVEVQIPHALEQVVIGARLRIAGPRRIHAAGNIDHVGNAIRQHKAVRAQLRKLDLDPVRRVRDQELL